VVIYPKKAYLNKIPKFLSSRWIFAICGYIWIFWEAKTPNLNIKRHTFICISYNYIILNMVPISKIRFLSKFPKINPHFLLGGGSGGSGPNMVRSIYTRLMLIKNKICSLPLQEVSMAGQNGHMSPKMHCNWAFLHNRYVNIYSVFLYQTKNM